MPVPVRQAVRWPVGRYARSFPGLIGTVALAFKKVFTEVGMVDLVGASVVFHGREELGYEVRPTQISQEFRHYVALLGSRQRDQGWGKKEKRKKL